MESQVRALRQREEDSLEFLRNLGVPDSEPRGVTLHFFTETPLAARQLVEVLHASGFEHTEIEPTEPECGLTSVTVVVEEAIRRVTSPSYSGFLFRLAAHLDGVYDGWGTTVKEATSPSLQPAAV
jgi:regulator of RNase E activity RraB